MEQSSVREKHVTLQSKALDARFLHNHSPLFHPCLMALAAPRRASPRGERSWRCSTTLLPPSLSPSLSLCLNLAGTRRPWARLSSNNNPEQQTLLITVQRASGCSRGQRPSAAYYSHCSPNDPGGLPRICKLTEQLPVRKLAGGLLSLQSWELMGKGE